MYEFEDSREETRRLQRRRVETTALNTYVVDAYLQSAKGTRLAEELALKLFVEVPPFGERFGQPPAISIGIVSNDAAIRNAEAKRLEEMMAQIGQEGFRFNPIPVDEAAIKKQLLSGNNHLILWDEQIAPPHEKSVETMLVPIAFGAIRTQDERMVDKEQYSLIVDSHSLGSVARMQHTAKAMVLERARTTKRDLEQELLRAYERQPGAHKLIAVAGFTAHLPRSEQGFGNVAEHNRYALSQFMGKRTDQNKKTTLRRILATAYHIQYGRRLPAVALGIDGIPFTRLNDLQQLKAYLRSQPAKLVAVPEEKMEIVRRYAPDSALVVTASRNLDPYSEGEYALGTSGNIEAQTHNIVLDYLLGMAMTGQLNIERAFKKHPKAIRGYRFDEYRFVEERSGEPTERMVKRPLTRGSAYESQGVFYNMRPKTPEKVTAQNEAPPVEQSPEDTGVFFGTNVRERKAITRRYKMPDFKRSLKDSGRYEKY